MTLERHILARNRVFWRILRPNRLGRLGCRLSEEPPQKSSRVNFGPKGGAKSRMRRNETPYPISLKFCMVVDTPDVITAENFGDDRIRDFGAAGVKFYLFPLTLIVVLTTLSHYRARVL